MTCSYCYGIGKLNNVYTEGNIIGITFAFYHRHSWDLFSIFSDRHHCTVLFIFVIYFSLLSMHLWQLLVASLLVDCPISIEIYQMVKLNKSNSENYISLWDCDNENKESLEKSAVSPLTWWVNGLIQTQICLSRLSFKVYHKLHYK